MISFKTFISENLLSAIRPQNTDVSTVKKAFPNLFPNSKKSEKKNGKKKYVRKVKIDKEQNVKLDETKTVTGRKIGFRITNQFGNSQYANIKKSHPTSSVPVHKTEMQVKAENELKNKQIKALNPTKKKKKGFKDFIKSNWKEEPKYHPDSSLRVRRKLGKIGGVSNNSYGNYNYNYSNSNRSHYI